MSESDPALLSPEIYMRRCLELAHLGEGQVAPNPMVGAVLVYGDQVIGEGFHQRYGEAHAEINCLQSVSSSRHSLIKEATLFVSLEPCAHHGKTPPCADRIIQEKIPRVVIGCRDPFPDVNGKGIEKLNAAGVKVELGILQKDCEWINRRFFTFHQKHRPYIILKWAQTANGRMGSGGANRWNISNEFSNRLVHRIRASESSVLVGTNTALLDDPQLNVRKWKGRDPVRVVIDMDLRLPSSLKLFSGDQRTIVFNSIKHEESEPVGYYQVTKDVSLVHQVINGLFHMGIQSVLIEGGNRLLQSFIDEQCWDEAIQITSQSKRFDDGLPAPQLNLAVSVKRFFLDDDLIENFIPLKSDFN